MLQEQPLKHRLVTLTNPQQTASNTLSMGIDAAVVSQERLVHFSTFDAAWGGNCLQAAPKPPEEPTFLGFTQER